VLKEIRLINLNLLNLLNLLILFILMNITELRKYRIEFNDKNNGIALFDLVASFLGAFLIDYFFNVSKHLNNFSKYPKLLYYLLIIPFGIIIHIITSQHTFLNKQLFSPEMNIYKILLIINIFMIFLIV